MKRLILASLAVVATLASCEKASVVDSAITNDKEMKFAPYAGASVTRGSAIGTNTDFKGTSPNYGSFTVAAYSGTDSYFGFRPVTWDGSVWKNGANMYWPNTGATLHFGAYYPTSEFAAASTAPTYAYPGTSGAEHKLTFEYTVADLATNQKDIMYALSDYTYTAPSTEDELKNDTDDAKVNLHFKHALTQIAFTATKETDLSVTVNSIKICNVVNKGLFTATLATDVTPAEDKVATEVNHNNFGSWANETAIPYDSTDPTAETYLRHYVADVAAAGVAISDLSVSGAAAADRTPLTGSEAMMLLPQALKAWDAKIETGDPANTGTESYLAIDCVIKHNDGTAPIIDGTIYIPFSTENIDYAGTVGVKDEWKPGYKITYNLHFGGGFTDPSTTPDVPKPGETPDPDKVVPTLRTITYDVTVDAWIPVDAPEIAM